MSMLKGFFGGVSSPQDQTTPKASEQRNPFDLLSSITPSRRQSQSTTGAATSQPLKTPTLQPRLSYTGSGSSTPGGNNSDGGLTTPGASVPGTPGGRALPTTGKHKPPLSMIFVGGTSETPRQSDGEPNLDFSSLAVPKSLVVSF